MAIFISGMKCKICGKSINDNFDVILFPAFVVNKFDPAYYFNDCAVHKSCFEKHSFYNKMNKLMLEFKDKMTPKNKVCYICKTKITNPYEYIPLGCVSSDENSQFYNLNFKHFHKSCFEKAQFQKYLEGWCLK